MAFTLFFNHIIIGQVTIDMSKEVSNSQEETTCDESLNVGFDDCFTDVSSKGKSWFKVKFAICYF